GVAQGKPALAVDESLGCFLGGVESVADLMGEFQRALPGKPLGHRPFPAAIFSVSSSAIHRWKALLGMVRTYWLSPSTSSTDTTVPFRPSYSMANTTRVMRSC